MGRSAPAWRGGRGRRFRWGRESTSIKCLVDHADAEGDGVGGGVDGFGLPIEEDLPSSRAVETVQLPHEGAFPRAVFGPNKHVDSPERT